LTLQQGQGQEQGQEQPQQLSSIKPPKSFTLDYLDYDQREKILKHLKAGGKTLKCHHKNCESFDIEYSTLYEYNVHCHTRHKKYPLHPELSLIILLKLEPRDNPWEPDSSTVTIIENNNNNDNNNKSKTYQEVEKGLDFLLSHFNQERQLFPRKIQTHESKGKQIEVFSKEEAMKYFERSDFVDCRINNFPSFTNYKGIQRYPPDSIFIDIDKSTFKDDKSFENALSKTLKNIKEKLNGHPTVNNSGNGYHILQPIECPIILEQINNFQKYQDKGFFISQEFLRFVEIFLSNGKADSRHYPSFKSCQIRVPGSFNGKCLNNKDKRLSGDYKVKTLQQWNGYRPSIIQELLEDFRTHLEQKITDQENSKNNNHYNNNYKYKNHLNHYSSNNNNRIEWIEKILLIPIEDCRKIIIDLILAPYLINIKKISYDEAYRVIKEWLDKCNNLKKLDNYQNFVNYRIHHALKTAASKGIRPMSFYKIKTDDRYRNTNLYLLILQNEKEVTSLNGKEG
jgi:predicted translin family RNA/ssDNA-binding protein